MVAMTLGTEIEFPAQRRYLRIARDVAGTMAMISDFTVDEIADLRLAVDEVGATLIPAAAPGSRVRFSIEFTDRCVTVSTEVRVTRPVLPDAGSFGWRILSVLADTVTTQVARRRSADGTQPTTMTLIKQHGTGKVSLLR